MNEAAGKTFLVPTVSALESNGRVGFGEDRS